MLTEEEEEKKRSDDGPRLTPQEKLAMKHGDESIKLPGAITTATGEVFNYTPYEGIIKLIKGKNDTTYKPKVSASRKEEGFGRVWTSYTFFQPPPPPSLNPALCNYRSVGHSPGLCASSTRSWTFATPVIHRT